MTLPKSALRLGEFVPMVAMMTAIVALSIDTMLPALPAIGADLGVKDPNDIQFVVTALMLGMGFGQLIYGPVSDSVGRKPTIYVGFAIFMGGCLLSLLATDFSVMIAGRFLQGVGAAAPRIVTIALVRDQYGGRAMARVMSFVMTVFILVPIIGPAVGQGILLFSGWPAIFWMFLGMAAISVLWFGVRQPETLRVKDRHPLSFRRILHAAWEVCTIKAALGYTIATGLVFAPFMAYLSSSQQIFEGVYQAGDKFPYYFGALAIAIGCASMLNARLVMRYGMRRLSFIAACGMTLIAGIGFVTAVAMHGAPSLTLFMSFLMLTFFCAGILFGNLNPLAMEPLGHIAGVGAAVVGSLSTFIAVSLGSLIGHAYDGTTLPLMGGFFFFGVALLLTIIVVGRIAPEGDQAS